MLGFSSRANWRNCCTARCWSIWYRLFIATLSFSWQKKPPSAHYDRGCESRYFLRINGHPQRLYPQSQIMWNGSTLETTFLDSHHLQTTITRETFESLGDGSSVRISVSQGSGCPIGGNSPALDLVIN